MTFKIWISTILFCLAAQSHALSKRNDAVNLIVTSNRLPGIAGLAIQGSGRYDSVAAGVRKAGNTTAVLTTKDKFHLGSITKSMTATLLAIIIEKGNGSLTWNSTLPQALPQIRNISSGFGEVTLAMMAAHRSGIVTADVRESNTTLWAELYSPGYSPVEGRKATAEQILRLSPEVAPNTGFNYSNINYLILGHIIDNQGAAWEERIKTDLFTPLGMDECGFGNPAPNNQTVDQPWPHINSTNGPIAISPTSMMPLADNPPTYGPAGLVHCSMPSYSKFLAFHLAAYKGENKTSLLSAASFSVLHTPFATPSNETVGEPLTSGGWGYSSASRFGGNFLVHAGSNTLNYAVGVVAPRRDVAVASLTNIGGTDAETGCLELLNGWFRNEIKFDGDAVKGNGTGAGTNAGVGFKSYSVDIGLLFLTGVVVAWFVY